MSGLNQQERYKIILVGVIILVFLATFFIYPKEEIFGFNIKKVAFGSKVLPWRLGLDLMGGSHLVYEIDMSAVAESDRDSVASGLREVIEQRVNRFGVSEPQVFFAKEGNSYRLIVELAGIKDVKDAIQEIGQTPLLDFREVVSSTILKEGSPQEQIEFLPTNLTGRYVKGAKLDFNPTTREPQISIQFNEEGAKIFEALTARNIGKPLAIFLDNLEIERPVVQEKISGGRAQITGRFSLEQARQFVQRFNAGALPAPIQLINQETVGASLGKRSLEASIVAGVIGTLLIILFMIFYYRFLGLFASLALLMYIVFTLAIFKLLPGFTMTLAGIAGFLLSIGMAVDANILIFERTKEELKRGLSKKAAIEEGFRRAWLSIRDSNISTMLTAFILYYSTNGFVKGFGLTLLIGVLVSMFSAIIITRTMLRIFVK